ncbi:MAG TPA: NAD(P)-dependent alcohol dehydrogenase [Actinocrinis sp.]|jgi:NADPH:quinone reductase-like Zn-dependent oxidoreductase
MKQFVLRSYGSADRLELAETDPPAPAPGEVLVRVRATSVNPYDWHGMRGEPYVARLMTGMMGLRRPRVGVLGCDLAGRVEAVGADVTRFRPGDDVYALVERGGGFAESAVVAESLLAPMPQRLSYEQAAAVPMAGVTALLALRELGRLQSGQTVLVNGASGGVGTFAVQIARALGAKVTGVCGPRNVELVASLGAEQVIDYSTQDFTRLGRDFDLMLDIAGRNRARSCLRILRREGTLVVVGGPGGRWIKPVGHVVSMLATGAVVPQRIVLAQVPGHARIREMLTELTELIENHGVTPAIDRAYPFAQIPDAVRYQEQGHAQGKVVVTV